MELNALKEKVKFIALQHFNLEYPTNENDDELRKYINDFLYKVKKVKIPISLRDEQKDLQERLERNYRNFVQADSFGECQYGCGVPRSADDRFIERLELERKLRDLNNIINALQDVQDYLFKDTAKALIELIDNETQKDILKQYYVYKKSATQIAYENYYSIDTIKQYRKRGLKAIVEVWKNQVKK